MYYNENRNFVEALLKIKFLGEWAKSILFPTHLGNKMVLLERYLEDTVYAKWKSHVLIEYYTSQHEFKQIYN